MLVGEIARVVIKDGQEVVLGVTAPLHGGQSGGPLVCRSTGQFVGLARNTVQTHSFVHTPLGIAAKKDQDDLISGLGMAIPASALRPLLEQVGALSAVQVSSNTSRALNQLLGPSLSQFEREDMEIGERSHFPLSNHIITSP